MLRSTLRVNAAQCSERGAKPENEDCMGLRVPEGTLLALKGVAAAIADGVSSAHAGREASETCVQSFLADFYSTPESWTVKTSAHRVLAALNHWLYSKGRAFREAEQGFITTLSILVLKGNVAHIFHVGDTRIARLRDGHLETLTTDHSVHVGKDQTYLGRAMGMDVNLHIDYREVPVRAGDVFFLSTDGLHEYVSPDEICKHIDQELTAATTQAQPAQTSPPWRDWDRVCRALIRAALDAGSPDNLTCQIIEVESVPRTGEDPLDLELLTLPFPPPLASGMKIDGLRVERELYASSRSQVYLVTQESSGRQLVMKTPAARFEDDRGYIERFAMEPWIGRRVKSPHVVAVVEPEQSPSWLYYLQEFVPGSTLADWIREHPEPDIREVLRIADQIAKGLYALHRRETYHRDLKPENILLGADGIVRVVDFGSCYVSGLHEIEGALREEIPLGTERYSAPEVVRGEVSRVRGDLFSFASILYEMLTGSMPYGEDTEKSKAAWLRGARYRPSTEKNPMIPGWMDAALHRALALDPQDRYRELSEFLYDLRHPNSELPVQAERSTSERDRANRWRNFAVVLLLLYIVTLAWMAS